MTITEARLVFPRLGCYLSAPLDRQRIANSIGRATYKSFRRLTLGHIALTHDVAAAKELFP